MWIITFSLSLYVLKRVFLYHEQTISERLSRVAIGRMLMETSYSLLCAYMYIGEKFQRTIKVSVRNQYASWSGENFQRVN